MYGGPIIIFSVDIELGITLIVLLSGCTPKPITPTSRRNPFSLLFYLAKWRERISPTIVGQIDDLFLEKLKRIEILSTVVTYVVASASTI